MINRSEKILDFLQPGGALELAAELQQQPQHPGSALFGRVLGDYEIYAHIADGGMSRVYQARRVDGRFDRDVAVKVSVAGLLDEQFRDRFFQEQQILASLNHPAIAQLYDAGIADEGWPYIVMELVQGVPIDEYCRQISINAKIKLIQEICSALRFAHARLVVHRDIKPANVLVTETGEPKLLDFGIAKLLTTSAAVTQAPSMTPVYASPEQLLGLPASVASDVYQVGLLLAQVLDPKLLNRPTDLMAAIRAASNDAAEILNPQVKRSLPKELVSIVEQCIRAEPEDRYTEVGEIQEDLDRYLRGFPVKASGSSAAYKVRKFVRRNAVYLTTGAAALTAFALSGAWYLSEVNDARNKAQFEAATSREVADFLAGLFSSSSPENLQGADMTAKELLDRGLDRIDEELADRPKVYAQLQSALGKVYKEIGNYDTAENLLSKAYAMQQRDLGEAHPSTLLTLMQRGSNASLQGDLQEAERIYRKARDLYLETLGPNHMDTLAAYGDLAIIYEHQGQHAAAKNILQEVIDKYRAMDQMNTIEGIKALTRLAVTSAQEGDPLEAIPKFEEALQLSRQLLGPTHIRSIEATNNLGVIYLQSGQLQKSLRYTEQTYKLALKVYGDKHHYSVSAAASHCDTLRQLGLLDEAREAAEYAYTTAKAHLPRFHRATNRAIVELGHVEMASGDYARAESLFLELYQIEQEGFQPDHPFIITTQLSIASAIAAQDRVDEAIDLVSKAVAALQRTQGPDHEKTLAAEKQLAELLAVAQPQTKD